MKLHGILDRLGCRLAPRQRLALCVIYAIIWIVCQEYSSASWPVMDGMVESKCPHCGALLRFGGHHTGQLVRCKACGGVFVAGPNAGIIYAPRALIASDGGDAAHERLHERIQALEAEVERLKESLRAALEARNEAVANSERAKEELALAREDVEALRSRAQATDTDRALTLVANRSTAHEDEPSIDRADDDGPPQDVMLDSLLRFLGPKQEEGRG